MTNTIKIKCNAENTLELAELTEFQGGLKQRTDIDYDKIKLSICKYGFSFPFFVWKNGSKNYLLDGHGRFATLCKMQKDGYTIPPLPVVYVSCKDKKEAKEKLLRLNSQYGKMSKESVLEFCSDIELNFDEIALPDTVIDFTDATEPQETEGDDEAPEVDEKSEPVSKRGEMYELGNSILMCGDSTDAEDVARLMGGEKADMVFTDPPYGMRLNTDYADMNGAKKNIEFKQRKNVVGGKTYNKVIGDNDDFKPELITTVFENFGYCKEIFLWGADYFAELLEDKNEGSWTVWDKRDNNEQFDKMYGSMFELCWSKNKHKREIARVRWCGVFGTETEFDKKRYHPTQKPIKLVEWFLSKYAEKGELCVDLYGGSGSTLIGCEKNGLRCRTMELDPHYCDVIRRRYTQWAKENGKPITSGCLE
jgi:DNA modification methylase